MTHTHARGYSLQRIGEIMKSFTVDAKGTKEELIVVVVCLVAFMAIYTQAFYACTGGM